MRNHVFIKEKVIQQNMYYKDHIIMKYTIKYPQFISEDYQVLLNKLNSYYRTRALMYERSNVTNLYQMAMVEYEYSIANSYPIREFEAYVDYTVTYNQNCAISLYFDQYEYAGGAHGLTLRYSDTWSLTNSKRMELNDIFPYTTKCKEHIINNIIEQIESGREMDNNPYFDDYYTLVSKNFKSNNYYLTKDGVIFYFQQYDIAPYASGIPTFLIPYGCDGAIEPKC
ncbi:DUF3298 and DUF4163 domain-containing protein [Mobilitalea sibirica]|uniref:DUF3298 and DUF4163 domain-containing protein n=1 Tax=Mobilitalea sibirica TaxID=1462919 RepID=A0A8J7L333_9FIRM|nr:DUF3298 and DUF4163 domain-containing protein [Mobilitalea sibirica]MBH1941708.1 DUF3298 and DUF4163 domain-containing protein [Mobilitalea sibirica]